MKVWLRGSGLHPGGLMEHPFVFLSSDPSLLLNMNQVPIMSKSLFQVPKKALFW